MVKLLTNTELADLPNSGWHNVKVDERKYKVSFTCAYEVDKDKYEILKCDGVLCRIVNDKYIVVNG